jgi:membrane protease YdiL (CAAX protease family)
MSSATDRLEFLVVIAFAFGYPVIGSLLSVFAPPSPNPPITEPALQGLLLSELLVMALLALLLRQRGWNLAHLGLHFSARDLLVALGLVAAASAAFTAVALMGDVAMPGFGRSSRGLVASGISLPTAVAVSAVNPVFEELFACAYVIRALERTRSVAFAVNVSTALRVAYHLYQGPAGAISMIPFGLLFGWCFARTGRLWPLVVAHGFFDLAGLLSAA